jgi:hypothetical protein
MKRHSGRELELRQIWTKRSLWQDRYLGYLVSVASRHQKKENLVKYPEQNKRNDYEGRNDSGEAQRTA